MPENSVVKKAKDRQRRNAYRLVECGSCMGYGHIDDETGQPSVDRRNRKCGDCRGTGSVPAVLPR